MDHRLLLRIVYLVESPFAVMAFHQLGLPAVSPFGRSVSEAQADIVAKVARGVVCLPDRGKRDEFDVRLLSRRILTRCPRCRKESRTQKRLA